MEIADDGDAHAHIFELLDDGRNGGGGFFVVDGHAHQFGAGAGQRRDLLDGGRNVRSVGVGHRLHHNWCIAADPDAADRPCNRFPALNISHGEVLV